jgi:serine O-acetyltransferase
MENARADLRRFIDLDSPSRRFSPRLLGNFGLQCVLTYRLGRALRRLPASLSFTLALPAWCLYLILATYVRKGYDIHLSLDASIGPGFYVGHFGGIRISACVIGHSCSVGQQTLIGPDTERGRGPTIGDKVWIGVHSKVLGPVVIGDGATIGAGTTIQADVSTRSLVMGLPPRVLQRDFDNAVLR